MKTVRKSKLDLGCPGGGLIHRHNFHSRVIVISFNMAAIAKGSILQSDRRVVWSQVGNQVVRRIISAAVNTGANEILLHT